MTRLKFNKGGEKLQKVKVTKRKWMGDDEFSWAVFRSDQTSPVYRGCSRMEAEYYKRIVKDMVEEEMKQLKF